MSKELTKDIYEIVPCCIYCCTPQNNKYACCGENHFDFMYLNEETDELLTEEEYQKEMENAKSNCNNCDECGCKSKST